MSRWITWEKGIHGPNMSVSALCSAGEERRIVLEAVGERYDRLIETLQTLLSTRFPLPTER